MSIRQATISADPVTETRRTEIAGTTGVNRRVSPVKSAKSCDSGDIDTSFQLRTWIDRYRATNRPVKVNFREAVPWVRYGDRATHYIHPYPAKLLPQIAYFFAHASALSHAGDTIFDPFGGTGTVGLEALLAGRNAISVDNNPLATLIATVKTRPISDRKLTACVRQFNARLRSRRIAAMPSVVNIEHWYKPKTIRSLREILFAVESERSEEIRRFLLVCFSVLIRRVSLCDPRLTVPVRLKSFRGRNVKGTAPSVRKLFREIVRQNMVRMKEFRTMRGPRVRAKIIHGDTRTLWRLTEKPMRSTPRLSANSVQLIISSPPYGGAQKYIRASSLSLGWLRLARKNELRGLEENTIGREHFHKEKYAKLRLTRLDAADKVLATIATRNPLRACISSTYLREMRASFRQIFKVLKPGGYLVLVIGNNMVARLPFLTNDYLTQALRKRGLELHLCLIDDIKSRGLMTKRNKTASVISREWVLLFRKPLVRNNVR